jgi:hypothetical protein
MTLLRSRHGAQAVEWQRRLLRREFSRRSYEISFLLAGLAFLAIGVLNLAGIIRFK